MKNLIMTIKIARGVSAVALLGLLTTPALALSNVVYVSGKGNNANSCDTVSAPCRSLQAAHNKVATGGEIVILDSASYGPLGISKSVSIVNDGAGVADVQQTTANANAITINSSGANVYLRGLSIDGAGVAANGVVLFSAYSLTMVNCVVRRFTASGVYMRPGAASKFAIIDSIVSDNARGVLASPSGGSASGILSNVQVTNNAQNGVWAGGTVSMTIVGGVHSRNGTGVLAQNGATIMVRDSASSNNSAAGYSASGAGAILRLAHSVAAGNNVGLQASGGGVAETYQDNNLRGNATAVGAGVVNVATQ